MLTAHSKTAHRSSFRTVARASITVLFLALIIFAVAKNWDQFVWSAKVIRQLPLWWLLLESGLFVLTMLTAALTYRLLALSKVRYKQLVLLELAAAGINRLLPAGSGSMGLHGLYLVKHRHTVPQATAVVSVNNALGLVTHFIALAFVIALKPATITGLQLHVTVPRVAFYVAGVVILLGLSLLFMPVFRRKIRAFLGKFYVALLVYRKHPERIVGAVGTTLLTTAIMIGVLYIALIAVGVYVPVLQVFVIYSVGVFFGAAVPTPGGLGGVEAGLVAGLIARGVDPAQALAGALLFRLFTYWLPLIVGSATFFISKKQKLF